MADNTDLDVSPSKWSLLQIGAVCVFSSLGYCGFTSLPYYVYAHTGLFFLPYYMLLVLVCVPVCYVQIKLGALYKSGLVGLFSHLVPVLKGVAMALLIMTYFRSMTHALEISYGLYYMFASCQQPFPWREESVVNLSSHEAKITIFDNIKTTSEDSYFVNAFLQRSMHIGSWSPMVWYLVLSAFTIWVFVYFIIWKGSAGFVKVMCILAPVTSLMVMVVLVYGYIAVPGSNDSLYTFLTQASQLVARNERIYDHHDSPAQHFLSRPKIWLDSLDLHVYGLGLWAGTLPFLGSHITCKKTVVNSTWIVYLSLYCLVPHLLLVMLVPYIDPTYPGGTLDYEAGIKPGMSYLFVSIPHTFSKHQLSPAIACLLYATYVLVNIQHLSFNILMIWENVWPCLPKLVITFFKKTQSLLATFCFVSFLLTAPYLSQCGIYLYQIIRFYVDRLLFALIIFSMVPFVIGFVRQEAMRTPIDRIFMGVWYGMASLITACLLIYNFVVFVYPEAVVSYEQRWAENLGWCVSVSPLILGVVSGALHTILKQTGSFKERLTGSLRAGMLPPDTGDDCLSVDTGDTDLKTPCSSQHTTPMTQARAPLLKHHANLSEKNLLSGNSHTLFPQDLSKLPLTQTSSQIHSTNQCINSPTAGRELFSHENSIPGYGTLQLKRNKASVEVVMRSTSDGNVAQL